MATKNESRTGEMLVTPRKLSSWSEHRFSAHEKRGKKHSGSRFVTVRDRCGDSSSHILGPYLALCAPLLKYRELDGRKNTIHSPLHLPQI